MSDQLAAYEEIGRAMRQAQEPMNVCRECGGPVPKGRKADSADTGVARGVVRLEGFDHRVRLIDADAETAVGVRAAGRNWDWIQRYREALSQRRCW